MGMVMPALNVGQCEKCGGYQSLPGRSSELCADCGGVVNRVPEREQTLTKYKNRPVRVEGVFFASQLEADHYRELQLLQQHGAISELKRQVPFALVVNGHKITTYVADATYRDQSGNLVVVDCKGFATPEYKLKRSLMKAVHGIVITEVKRKTK